MATTQLSDFIAPTRFSEFTSLRMLELNRFWTSGVIEPSEQLSQFAASGGQFHNISKWNSLSIDQPEASQVSNDDPADIAVAQKVTGINEICAVFDRNNSWSSADLSAATAGDDPMGVVAEQVADHWARAMEHVLINMTSGMLAENLTPTAGSTSTGNVGDMLHAAALPNATALPVLAANQISGANIAKAVATMGDRGVELVAMAMPQVLMTRLAINGMIQYLREHDANLQYPTFNGIRVIVDDTLSKTSTSDPANRSTHFVLFFGRGAFSFGESMPKVPVEIKREALEGNGGGVEYFVSRKRFILHPNGYQVIGSANQPGGLNDSQLLASTAYARVVARKRVKIAYMAVNED